MDTKIGVGHSKFYNIDVIGIMNDDKKTLEDCFAIVASREGYPSVTFLIRNDILLFSSIGVRDSIDIPFDEIYNLRCADHYSNEIYGTLYSLYNNISSMKTIDDMERRAASNQQKQPGLQIIK